MEGVIYKLTSPSGKSYIGQSINPEKRYVVFLNKNKSYGGPKIDKAREKYGPENFTYEILERCSFENENELFEKLDELEIYYIKKYDALKNGYNLTKGGRNNIKYESLYKMSDALKEHYKEHQNPFKGHKHTDETKKVISEKLKKYYETHDSPFKGHHPSDEQRRRQSELAKQNIGDKNSFYGKHHSDETKKKIADANSIPVLQIDKDTNEVINEFKSIAEAERHFGTKPGFSTIVYICKNKPKQGRYLKTWKGFKWAYKINEGSTTIPKGSTIK